MAERAQYTPGPANVAHVEKDGEKWTLVLVRDLRHAPEKVWQAITDPAHLRAWAPFDADGSLATSGATVKLTTVGAPAQHVTATTVTRADAPKTLVYNWGGFDMRWELEAVAGGTRLTLWTNIDRRYIAMGAAGWHICLDVLDRHLGGTPIGRIAGPDAMKFDGWQRLNAEYAKQFGIGGPKEIEGIPMNPSALVDRHIATFTDWRGKTFARIRKVFLEADPEIIEEFKWMGTPVWSRDGMIAVANAYKGKVKITFAYGASLPDPDKIFNADLEGNARRAIDIFEDDKLNERALKNMILAAIDYNHVSLKKNQSKPKKKAPATPRATVRKAKTTKR